MRDVDKSEAKTASKAKRLLVLMYVTFITAANYYCCDVGRY